MKRDQTPPVELAKGIDGSESVRIVQPGDPHWSFDLSPEVARALAVKLIETAEKCDE